MPKKKVQDTTQLKKYAKCAILTKKGYTLKKDNMKEEDITFIKKLLTVKPVVNKKFAAAAQEFPVFYENKSKLYLPRFWGIDNIGEPAKTILKKGDKIDVKCVFKPRDAQVPIVKKIKSELKEKGGSIISVGCGVGKCHGKDTPILMYDGTIKMVQNILPGEQLMGDDSTPRNVLSTCSGKEMLYKIIPQRGNPYIVNESHILSLRSSTNKGKYKKGDVIDISLKDYLKLSKMYHGKGSPLCGYKVPVDFPEKKVDVDPYIIGLWLGDGSSNGYTFTTNNHQILKYLFQKLPEYNIYLEYYSKFDYRIKNSNKGNKFAQILRKYNLINNKHIPLDFKSNSRENRLKLLAGLIDTDGYKCKSNIYSITQKNEKLMDDIVFLCLSLGFYAEKRVVWKSCTNGKNDEKRKYFQTSISGFGIEEIPVLIDRKKCEKRKQIKNPLNSLITVEKLEVGDYYGFEIDGNHRYLLGDFTVTHNTFISLYLSTLFKQKTLIVVHTSVLLNQWIERINQFIPNAKIGKIQGDKFEVDGNDYVIGMLQTLSSGKYEKEMFSTFGFTIMDECFTYDTGIITENGYELIGSLYELWIRKKELPKILSYNKKTKKFEYKKMTYAWRKERNDLVKIKASKKIIKCTPEHKIMTNKGYIKAKDLTIGDLLLSFYDNNQNANFNYVSQGLNDDQKQILYGSFLGDGCIQKINGENRIRLSIIHCEKQYEYCMWKANMFGINNIRKIENNGFSNKIAYTFSTKIIDIEKEFLFPKNKHTCPQWILDKIDERGLCIWFLDDGYCSKYGNQGSISTHSFDDESQKRIKNTLKNKFGIDSKIVNDNRGKGKYIRLKKDGLIKIKSLIKKYICINNMLYKINNETQNECYVWNSKFMDYGYTRVDSVTEFIYNGYGRQTKPYVYDIEVEDNHNFIICGNREGCNKYQGIIVSNCHHIAAPSFSKALPLVATKYLVGLSATPKRPDKLEKIFEWYVGNYGWIDTTVEDRYAIIKGINFSSDTYEEIQNYNGSINLAKMLEKIVLNKNRNDLIINQIKVLSRTGRQILILSNRKKHLKLLKDGFDELGVRNEKTGELITSDYYIGGLKKEVLDIAATKNVIFGTYQLIAEGTDIPTLNTLIMASPRKFVEQVVGRIFRAKTAFTPLVIDIADDYSIYRNQGLLRRRYYKKNDFHIDSFNICDEDYDPEFEIKDTEEDISMVKKLAKKKENKKNKKKSEPKSKSIRSFCLIDDDDDD
jgi:superfamily II DNA or RNA helicase